MAEKENGQLAGTAQDYDVAQIMGGLYGDGFISLKGAFSREWVRQLDEDHRSWWFEIEAPPGG